MRLAKDARVSAKLLNIGATTDKAGKPEIAPTSLGTYITEPGNISDEESLNHLLPEERLWTEALPLGSTIKIWL